MANNEQKPPDVCAYLYKIDNKLRRCYSVKEYETIKLQEQKEYILREERCYNNLYCYWSWRILIIMSCISVLLMLFLDRMNDKELIITILIFILTLVMFFIFWYYYK